MNWTEMLREIRMARFEEIYERWCRKRVTQAWAASVLGVTDRTFRRWVVPYEAGGLAALKDKRVAGPSPRRYGKADTSCARKPAISFATKHLPTFCLRKRLSHCTLVRVARPHGGEWLGTERETLSPGR